MSSIVTLCLSAGIQKTITFNTLKTGKVNRSASYKFDASGKAVNSARVLSQLMDGAMPDESVLPAAPEGSAYPDDLALVCPLGKNNADFFSQLAARDGLNADTVLIPGYTRECCTLLDKATGDVTELVVEEPKPEGDAPVDELLLTLRTALARCSAFSPAGSPQKSLPRTALLFAGSRPSFWPAEVVPKAVIAARKAGALLMADFRGPDLLNLLPAATDDKLSPAHSADGAGGELNLAHTAGSAGDKLNPAHSAGSAGDKLSPTHSADSAGVGLNPAHLAGSAAGSLHEACSAGAGPQHAAGKASGGLNPAHSADGGARSFSLIPDIIKINEDEFRETFMNSDSANGAAGAGAGDKLSPAHTAGTGAGASLAQPDLLAAAIAEESRRLSNIIVVTRGADETIAADHGKLYRCPTERIQPVNTIGCGDSFNSGFLYEYLATGNVERALRLGTWCAARNAEQLSPGALR